MREVMRDTHNPYHVLLSLKRGTLHTRHSQCPKYNSLTDYCVKDYCGLLFNYKYTFANECFFISYIKFTHSVIFSLLIHLYVVKKYIYI